MWLHSRVLDLIRQSVSTDDEVIRSLRLIRYAKQGQWIRASDNGLDQKMGKKKCVIHLKCEIRNQSNWKSAENTNKLDEPSRWFWIFHFFIIIYLWWFCFDLLVFLICLYEKVCWPFFLSLLVQEPGRYGAHPRVTAWCQLCQWELLGVVNQRRRRRDSFYNWAPIYVPSLLCLSKKELSPLQQQESGAAVYSIWSDQSHE